ncbi:hypothetical protein HSB1_10310 [Halogranum salarium B-1]|uniref:Uncharacterized protein n=1 Tax=Halogranum salarium B-1 TaxID=1210908 RepID=J3A4N4_9EURY|nr:hypothetical protein HSB1_10310 [Halogranum salarium B-1]
MVEHASTTNRGPESSAAVTVSERGSALVAPRHGTHLDDEREC